MNQVENFYENFSKRDLIDIIKEKDNVILKIEKRKRIYGWHY